MIEAIVNFLELVVWFMVSWILAFVLHEYFHKLSCERQGGKAKIEIWFYQPSQKYKWLKLPSMRCSCEAGTGQSLNWKEIDYMGGIGSGFISIAVSVPFYWLYLPLFIGLFIAGTTNFIYGIFEGTYLRRLRFDDYMRYHYLAEGIGLLLGIVLIREIIWSWVF